MFERCPCGLGPTYLACCARYHSGQAVAPTAEALMRARYSAFARRDPAFLMASWAPETRPPGIEFGADETWLGLEVERAETAGDTAIVRFAARWRRGGQVGVQRETSRFRREDGRWLYVDGR
ncbi:MAG: YchJ family metal-binding protein [Pseudomonadota bacterium]